MVRHAWFPFTSCLQIGIHAGLQDTSHGRKIQSVLIGNSIFEVCPLRTNKDQTLIKEEFNVKKVFSILLALALLAVAGYAMADAEHLIVIDRATANANEVITEPTCTSYGTALVKCPGNDPSQAPKGSQTVQKKNGNWFYKAYIAIEEHEYEFVTAGTPVCNAGGAITKVCKNCGATEDSYVTLDATIHDFGTWNVLRESTCTEKGLEVRICNRCLFEQYATLKLAKHVYVEATDKQIADAEKEANVEPTCTDKGSKWYICSVCKGDWVSKEIPALGHDIDYTKTPDELVLAPTCHTTGLALYGCSRCDVLKPVTLAKTAHKFELDKAASKKPTCLEDGENVYVCVNECEHEDCEGCTETKTEKVAKTGHNWGEWKQIVKPSETTKGMWERFCQNEGCTAPAEHFVGDKLDNADRTSGLKEVDGEWIYVENDKPVTDKTGIVEFEGGKFLVVNGKVEKVTKLYEVTEGQFILLIDGKVSSYTGLVEYDGAWFYLENGKVATNVCGLKAYDGAEFVVANGQVLTGLNGLWQDHNSTEWYYIAAGKKTTYTGLAQYDGAWFYVTNGKLDTTFSGEVEYDGATFTVVNGMLAL